MAYIKINLNGVERDNAALKNTLVRLETVESQLSQLSGQLDSTLQPQHEIAENLRACKSEIAAILIKGGRLHTAAVSGVRAYRSTETTLNREAHESAKLAD